MTGDGDLSGARNGWLRSTVYPAAPLWAVRLVRGLQTTRTAWYPGECWKKTGLHDTSRHSRGNDVTGRRRDATGRMTMGESPRFAVVSMRICWIPAWDPCPRLRSNWGSMGWRRDATGRRRDATGRTTRNPPPHVVTRTTREPRLNSLRVSAGNRSHPKRRRGRHMTRVLVRREAATVGRIR